MSVISDTERYRPQYPPPVGAGVLPRPYFDHEDFLEQETRHKFDQLARLHELYQSKLALANVSNSVTYQRENSSNANVRETPCKSRQSFLRPSFSSTVCFSHLVALHARLFFSVQYSKETFGNANSVKNPPSFLLAIGLGLYNIKYGH